MPGAVTNHKPGFPLWNTDTVTFICYNNRRKDVQNNCCQWSAADFSSANLGNVQTELPGACNCNADMFDICTFLAYLVTAAGNLLKREQ